MNFFRWMACLIVLLGIGLMARSAGSDTADSPTISARDLADRLSALQEGNSYTRLRLEVKQPPDTTKVALQLQIKERRSKSAADVLYQVLWPQERKGEAILLSNADGGAGSRFTPPDKRSTLNTSQMGEALFDSDLSYRDLIENFFAWQNQAIVGNELVNRVNCLILESRPGKAAASNYASVRSWIDVRRMVPLRVEKYGTGGRLIRRIDTTRVVTDDRGHSIPAALTVHGPRTDSFTELDGSRIKHNVTYTDREFTPEGLEKISTPSSAPE